MIKAIQTRYKGYHFRSRLEARWAVFFDAMGWNWEYEPEGFDLGNGLYYLPDFKITLFCDGFPIEHWYEIKPSHEKDDGKMRAFQQLFSRIAEKEDTMSSFRGGVLTGDPFEYFEVNMDHYNLPVGSKSKACARCGDLCCEADYFVSGEMGFLCYPCDPETHSGGNNDPEKDGVFECEYTPHKGWIMVDSDYYGLLVKRKIESAAVKARSARFEHGETPNAN